MKGAEGRNGVVKRNERREAEALEKQNRETAADRSAAEHAGNPPGHAVAYQWA
jgi:hypothetical protein